MIKLRIDSLTTYISYSTAGSFSQNSVNTLN